MSFHWYVIIFAAAAFAVVGVGLWQFVKYRERPPIVVVRYYPPEGLGPLQYSAFWHGYARKKDIPTLILKWAADGCVKIEKDGKKDVIVTRLKDLPKTATQAERSYFSALFSDDDYFHSYELKGRKNVDRRNAVAEAVSQLKKEARRYQYDCEDPKINKGRRIMGFSATAAMLIFSCYFPIALEYYALFVVIFFFAVHLGVPTYIAHTDRSGKSGFGRIIPITIFGVVDIIFLSAIFSVFNQIDVVGAVIFCIFAVWWFVCTLFMRFLLKKRTDKSQQYYGEMLGFRKFILEAELPRIKELVAENPDYFLDVLPYCIIMDMSSVVEKKFKMLGTALPAGLASFGGEDGIIGGLKLSIKGAFRARKLKRYTK